MSSRSFMDAIRGVVLTEGAKDKTSDGMTKDAKHFAQDLHKVQDSGMKHLVQKDSETKDYEKMFSGGVEKFPTRLADMEPSQSVDKYVEYNEAVEAKKKAKKDDEKVGDQSNAEDATGPMTEIYAVPGTPAGNAYEKQLKGNSGKPALPLQANQKMPLMRDKGQGGRVSPFKAPAPKPSSGAPQMAPGTHLNRPKATPPKISSPGGATQQPYGMKPGLAKPGGATQQPYGMKGPSSVPKPKIKPSTGGTNAPVAKGGGADKFGGGQKPQIAKPQAAKPGAAKPQVAKPQAAKPKLNPLQQQQQRSKTGRDEVAGPRNRPQGGITTGNTVKQKAQPRAKAPAGTNPLKNSYEIEWNGNSYMMNEAQIEALSAFIEKYGLIEGTAGEFIKKEMEHPEKLTAKGKKQKIKQSLAIYYSKKRRGENP